MSAHQIDVKTPSFTVEIAELAGGLVIRVNRNDGAAVHLVEGAVDDNDNEDIGLSGDVVEVYFG